MDKDPNEPEINMTCRETLFKEISNFEKQIESKENEIHSVRDKITFVQESIAKDAEAHDSRMLADEHKVAELKLEIQTMEEKVSIKKQEVDIVRNEVRSLTSLAQTDNDSSSKQNTDGKHQELYATIEKLKNDILEKQKHVEGIQLENDALEITMNNLTGVIADKKNKLASSKLELKEHLAQLKATEENKAFLASQIAMLKGNRTGAQSESLFNEVEVDRQGTLNEFISLKKFYRSKKDAATREISDIQAKIDSIEAQKESSSKLWKQINSITGNRVSSGIQALQLGFAKLNMRPCEPDEPIKISDTINSLWLFHLIENEKNEVKFWLEEKKKVEQVLERINFSNREHTSKLAQLKHDVEKVKLENLWLKEQSNDLKNKDATD